MSIVPAEVRYPIGKFQLADFDEVLKKQLIADIQFLPNDLEMAIQTFDEYQLDTPYREGGWTVKQLVHHIADSHMHAYLRFKFALTEDNPTIKPYEEKDWALLPDVLTVPVNVSVTLLHALHNKWTALVRDVTTEQWLNRSIYHPEQKTVMSLWMLLGLYAWHGKHHVSQINQLKEQKGW